MALARKIAQEQLRALILCIGIALTGFYFVRNYHLGTPTSSSARLADVPGTPTSSSALPCELLDVGVPKGKPDRLQQPIPFTPRDQPDHLFDDLLDRDPLRFGVEVRYEAVP